MRIHLSKPEFIRVFMMDRMQGMQHMHSSVVIYVSLYCSNLFIDALVHFFSTISSHACIHSSICLLIFPAISLTSLSIYLHSYLSVYIYVHIYVYTWSSMYLIILCNCPCMYEHLSPQLVYFARCWMTTIVVCNVNVYPCTGSIYILWLFLHRRMLSTVWFAFSMFLLA